MLTSAATVAIVDFSAISASADTSGDFEYSVSNLGTAVEITGYTGSGGNVVIPYAIDDLPVISIGDYAFSGCISLTSVTIPVIASSIGAGAFYGCSALTSVNISPSITSIGYAAFYGCSALSSVIIPDNVTSIGYAAFYGCSALRSVVISNGLTNIGNATFYGCSALTSVTIPSSVTEIGNAAFSGSILLPSVTIPDSVTNIGGSAFFNCSNLRSVNIPDSVTSIGYAAFAYCSALNAINVDRDSQNFVSVGGVLYDQTITELIQCPGNMTGAFVIPGSVVNIGYVAFAGCTSLTSYDSGQRHQHRQLCVFWLYQTDQRHHQKRKQPR